MKLYHGSNMGIEVVDLARCRPYKDFGQGFYVTTIQEQAEKMAKRVSRIYGGSPCVTVYDLDERVFEDESLNIRSLLSQQKNGRCL